MYVLLSVIKLSCMSLLEVNMMHTVPSQYLPHSQFVAFEKKIIQIAFISRSSFQRN